MADYAPPAPEPIGPIEPTNPCSLTADVGDMPDPSNPEIDRFAGLPPGQASASSPSWGLPGGGAPNWGLPGPTEGGLGAGSCCRRDGCAQGECAVLPPEDPVPLPGGPLLDKVAPRVAVAAGKFPLGPVVVNPGTGNLALPLVSQSSGPFAPRPALRYNAQSRSADSFGYGWYGSFRERVNVVGMGDADLISDRASGWPSPTRTAPEITPRRRRPGRG